MLKLSQRLLTLAQMVPRGSRVADIGTDHALLPCYLVKEKIAAQVIGVEVNKEPYKKAFFTVNQYDLQKMIEIRLGNGLTVLEPHEVQVVIFAGIGGAVICEILEKSPQVLSVLDRIIVQPMRNAELVRLWLVEHGWIINEEKLVYEGKQYYQIIQAKQVSFGEKRQVLTAMEADYGPLLIKARHPLLYGLLEKDLEGLQEILRELANSNKEEAQISVLKYRLKMQNVKELKKWLPRYIGGGQ